MNDKKWKLGKQCLEIKGMEWKGPKYIYQEFQMEIVGKKKETSRGEKTNPNSVSMSSLVII